jgi:N-acetylmuramoyl-L-alanine amidase
VDLNKALPHRAFAVQTLEYAGTGSRRIRILDFPPDTSLVTALSPSPNFEPRVGARAPDMIVLHYTGMQTADGALVRLCEDKEPRVSCHYLVHEDGAIVQLVQEEMRAWHAGISSWEGETDINSRSIGIEIVNPGHDFGYPDFPAAQIQAVIALCKDIIARHNIRADRVLAHSDVAPGRKIDPGEKFPWRTLHENGVGHFVEPKPLVPGTGLQVGDEGESVAEVQSVFVSYGYGLDVNRIYDDATENVVSAFQRHFRPSLIDGVYDSSTAQTLARLLATRPARAA